MNARILKAMLLVFPLGLAIETPQPGQSAAPAIEPESPVLVLTATLDDQAISPGTLRYLERAIGQARQRQAECLVVFLDTPGGLLTSTRRLTRQMLASDTPIVVYVAPSGSRAASAGVFITLASHVAAMAPGTSIGAAHPVQIDAFPVGPDPERTPENDENDTAPPARPPAEEKIVSDTVAWAQALAEMRDRNAEWAADAVRHSVSVTASEAVDQGVVELVAEDLEELLEGLHGREVVTVAGPLRLQTADAEVEALPIWWGEQLLILVAQPNVAFLLMIFGFYGILFELYSPGWGVSGIVGAVCLVLALFGLAVLPVDYLGLALIVIALGLLVAEVFVTSYGALAAAGAACLTVGGIMLVDSPEGFARVSLSVVLPVALATVVIVLLLVGGIVRVHWGSPRTGSEGLLGRTARVVDDFAPQDDAFRGRVAVHGERWGAVSRHALKAGETCRISHVEGLTLTVEPAEASP